MTLQPHDLVPHFTVTDWQSRPVAYRDIWQRKNLVLISSPDAARTHGDLQALADDDTAVVMTPDAVPGLPQPGALVADRWGEIYHVASGDPLPDASELQAWLRYVQVQCPECQGEVK